MENLGLIIFESVIRLMPVDSETSINVIRLPSLNCFSDNNSLIRNQSRHQKKQSTLLQKHRKRVQHDIRQS